jgi:hypothetical protein
MKITRPPISAPPPPAPEAPVAPAAADVVRAPEVLRAMRLQAPPADKPEFGRALVVIHGIGQQQPFEPLDSFVNGLRASLGERRPPIPDADRAVHMIFGRENAFDHGMRVAGADLDVYEVYWAPLTQRKASFVEIVKWLVLTSFTPIQQLAFNLPLLFRRAHIQWRGGQTLPRILAAIFSVVLFFSGLRRGQPIDLTPGESELKASWYIFCLVRELVRMIAILLAGLVAAALAAGLVSSSASLLGQLPAIWRDTLPAALSWRDSLTALLFAAAVVAAVVVGFSILPQLREAVNDTTPPPPIELGIPPSRNLLGRMTMWGRPEAHERLVQSNARFLFLLLSLVMLLLLCGLLYRFILEPPPCAYGFCLTNIIAYVWSRLGPEGRWHLLVIGGVAALAALVKAFFIDYVADVTLYTVTNENSPFAQVRRDILAATAAKVKWLLRKYQTVTVAGHSLGSVIGYDTINRLRAEARVAESQAADIRRRAGALRALLGKTMSGPAAKDADALMVRIVEAFDPGWAATEVGHARQALQQLEAVLHDAGVTDQAVADSRNAIEDVVKALTDPAAAPLSRAELNRLTTLVTFGSPLNKVLYFFRTRVGVTQTVRAHIINDLHGFRLPRELFASDPGISDDAAAGRFSNAAPPDGLYWLNVSARLDFVSAPLDFYDEVHEYRRWYWLPGACHTSYWRDGRFYDEVLAALQRAPARARAPLWAAKP